MLDMGEPVLILDLAERMIRLSGRQPGTDIKIEIMGVRPGEKLTEELISLEESEAPTAHPSIRRIVPHPVAPDLTESNVLHLEQLAKRLQVIECGTTLMALAASPTDLQACPPAQQQSQARPERPAVPELEQSLASP